MKRKNSLFRCLFIIVLSIAILVSGFAVLGESNILLSGDNEAESSTVVYNAIKEFNYTDKQSSVWRYQSTDDADNPVWCDLDGSVPSGGYWYDSTYRSDALRMSHNGNMRIWNKADCLASANRPSLCWCFIAPRDGEIQIPKTTVTYREGDVQAGVRITLNGVQLYPETGWISVDAENSAVFSEIVLDAEQGDMLRFEMSPLEMLGSAALGVRWNPIFYFIDTEKNQIEQDGIFNGLSAFMYDYFSNLTASNAVDQIQNNKESAATNVNKSRYGTYSVSDAFYDNGILDSSDSSVWKFAVNSKNNSKNTYGDIVYLCDSFVKNSGKSFKSVVLSDENITSSYEVFVSYKNLESGSTKPYNRAVTYSANENEQMMFGFTAPFSGEYELSAPFFCDTPLSVEYFGVLKQTANDRYIELEGKNIFDGKDYFCHLQIELLKGETLWLTANVKSEATIDIGIPTLRYFEDVSSGNIDYRRYRAVDYFESSYSNGKDYGLYSLTDKRAGGWNFGYFINPIDDSGLDPNYDTLGYGEYKIGDDATPLTEKFVPYELTRGGIYYNALPSVITADDKLLTANGLGVIGVMYPCLETGWGNRSKTGVPYLCSGIYSSFGVAKTRAGNLCNMGVYLNFTAPKSGDAVLDLSKQANITVGDKMLILKNGIVISEYSGIVGAGKTIDIGFLNEDDTVTLCYGMTTAAIKNVYIGMPIITVSGNIATVDLDEYDRTRQSRVSSGKTFTLPNGSNVAGRRFVGWLGSNDNVLDANTPVAISSNDCFEAVYELFGDINNDGVINSHDMILMCKILLGCDFSGEIKNADVIVDGDIDIIDFIRFKKWFAGMSVVLGDQSGLGGASND